MISLSNLFIIEEEFFPESKQELIKYFKNPKIKNFIELSKKVVTNGVESLSEPEKVKFRGYFDDEEVQNYVNAARRAGERDGWLYGGAGGGISGLLVGAAGGAQGGTVLSIVAAILGAAVGGTIAGWTFSKVNSWLRKWRAEDDIVKLGKVGGKLGRTMPILNVG